MDPKPHDGFVRPLSPEQQAANFAAWQGTSGQPVRAANVIPALTLGQARVVTYRGQSYTLRRLRYVDGLALHGLFTELVHRKAGTDPDAGAMLALARAVVAQLGLLLRPVSGWRRWAHRVVSQLASPFEDAEWGELHALVADVLCLPDELPRPTPGAGERPSAVDLMDQLVSFVRDYPAWVGADGYPRSWAHYMAANQHAGRESARRFLAEYGAASMARSAAHGAAVEPVIEKVRERAGLMVA